MLNTCGRSDHVSVATGSATPRITSRSSAWPRHRRQTSHHPVVTEATHVAVASGSPPPRRRHREEPGRATSGSRRTGLAPSTSTGRGTGRGPAACRPRRAGATRCRSGRAAWRPSGPPPQPRTMATARSRSTRAGPKGGKASHANVPLGDCLQGGGLRQRVPHLLDAAAGGQAAVAGSGWGAGGVEHVPPVLPADAAGGLPAGGPYGPRGTCSPESPAPPVARAGRRLPPHVAAPRQRAAGAERSGYLAAGSSGAHRGRPVPGALQQHDGRPELVCAAQRRRARPGVHALSVEQRREPARIARVPGAGGTGADHRTAAVGVGDVVRGPGGVDRRVRPRNQRHRRRRRRRRGTSPVSFADCSHAGALGRAGLRAVELHDQRHQLHHVRPCGRAPVVGRAAGALPVLVRAGLRRGPSGHAGPRRTCRPRARAGRHRDVLCRQRQRVVAGRHHEPGLPPCRLSAVSRAAVGPASRRRPVVHLLPLAGSRRGPGRHFQRAGGATPVSWAGRIPAGRDDGGLSPACTGGRRWHASAAPDRRRGRRRGGVPDRDRDLHRPTGARARPGRAGCDLPRARAGDAQGRSTPPALRALPERDDDRGLDVAAHQHRPDHSPGAHVLRRAARGAGAGELPRPAPWHDVARPAELGAPGASHAARLLPPQQPGRPDRATGVTTIAGIARRRRRIGHGHPGRLRAPDRHVHVLRDRPQRGMGRTRPAAVLVSERQRRHHPRETGRRAADAGARVGPVRRAGTRRVLVRRDSRAPADPRGLRALQATAGAARRHRRAHLQPLSGPAAVADASGGRQRARRRDAGPGGHRRAGRQGAVDVPLGGDGSEGRLGQRTLARRAAGPVVSLSRRRSPIARGPTTTPTWRRRWPSASARSVPPHAADLANRGHAAQAIA